MTVVTVTKNKANFAVAFVRGSWRNRRWLTQPSQKKCLFPLYYHCVDCSLRRDHIVTTVPSPLCYHPVSAGDQMSSLSPPDENALHTHVSLYCWLGYRHKSHENMKLSSTQNWSALVTSLSCLYSEIISGAHAHHE